MCAVIGKNSRTWEEYLPFVEFAYNRVVHSATNYSPFELVYGFSPLSLLDFAPLPIQDRVNLDGKKNAEVVRHLNEKARLNIERKTKQYETQANKGRRHITFEPGDWVWEHLQNDRFPMQRKSKLQPRGGGPF